MSGTALRVPVAPEEREKLVLIIFPKRVGFLFYYVFGAVLILIGFLYNVATAGGWIFYNELSWIIGLCTIFVGAVIMAAVETRRRFILYIITTWNVRIRRGIIKRHTTRVFYDDIEYMETTASPEEKIAGMGNLFIYSRKVSTGEPALVFRDIYNPEGIREIIQRFVDTLSDPVPWSHIEH
ncbi:MAG: PH domain-containing protein [Candidatus Thorarchaeota archaeon]|nr:PH domain-containing protein [Candidatus Thorarchaeota archaeon]